MQDRKKNKGGHFVTLQIKKMGLTIDIGQKEGGNIISFWRGKKLYRL